MIKDIKNAKEISLSNVLSGNYITTENKWTKLDEETASELFQKFRNFVACTARGNRRWRILNTQRWYLTNYGIFNRLIYNFEREKVEYIAGQDYISEMGILRDCFDR